MHLFPPKQSTSFTQQPPGRSVWSAAPSAVQSVAPLVAPDQPNEPQRTPGCSPPSPTSHPTTPSSLFAKVTTQSAELHTSNSLAGSGCRCCRCCAASFLSLQPSPTGRRGQGKKAARTRFLKLGSKRGAEKKPNTKKTRPLKVES